MVKFILRLLINGIAIWVASLLLSGITLEGSPIQILIVVIVFGLVNAIIKPLFKLLTLPLVIITLGLFTLVINTVLLWFVALITPALSVDGFVSAFFGSIIISIVSAILSLFLDD